MELVQRMYLERPKSNSRPRRRVWRNGPRVRSLDKRVRDLKNDIQGVRGSLDLAQTNLELQAGQISALKTCLNGVSIAFDRVLVENYPAAAAALESVEARCNQAFSLL